MKLAFAAATVAAMFCAVGAVSAQTVPTTPLLIHEVDISPEPRTAQRNEPLVAQPVTSLRAVRLLGDVMAIRTSWASSIDVTSGTVLAGVQTGAEWSYCANRSHWWTGNQTACFLDTDSDGHFDHVMPSNESYTPYTVYTARNRVQLATPIPYERAPVTEAKLFDLAVGVSVIRPSRRNNFNGTNLPPLQPTHLEVSFGTWSGGSVSPFVGTHFRTPVTDGKARISVSGIVIEVDSIADDNTITYRVLQTMPRHIDRILQNITPPSPPIVIYI